MGGAAWGGRGGLGRKGQLAAMVWGTRSCRRIGAVSEQLRFRRFVDDILSPLLSLEPMPYKSSAGKTNGLCVCVF